MKTRKSRVYQVIGAMCLILGVLLLNYPTVVTTYNNITVAHQPKKGDLDSPSVNKIIEEAEKYNKSIKNQPIYDPWNPENRGLENSDYKKYKETLSFKDGIIGKIFIPKISVSIPVYHDSTDEVLNKGVGHIFGSYLPVGGGKSILTGHRGMTSATMFDNLPELTKGDEVYMFFGGQKRAWRVKDQVTILPTEINELTKDMDEDSLYLVTCTPYGVNTHRLIVIAERAKDLEKNKYPNIDDSIPEWWKGVPWWAWIIYGVDLSGTIGIVILHMRENKTRKSSKRDLKVLCKI